MIDKPWNCSSLSKVNCSNAVVLYICRYRKLVMSENLYLWFYFLRTKI